MNLSPKLLFRGLIICVVVVVAAIAGGTWYFIWGGNDGQVKPAALPAEANSPEKILAYFKSDEFQKLDRNVRRVTAMATFERITDERAHEFCNLPPERRDAYLDGVIDQMAALRQQGEGLRGVFGPGPGPGGGGGGAGGGFGAPGGGGQGTPDASSGGGGRGGGRRGGPGAMRARMESQDPQKRAERTAFFNAMRQRMTQRGVGR